MAAPLSLSFRPLVYLFKAGLGRALGRQKIGTTCDHTVTVVHAGNGLDKLQDIGICPSHHHGDRPPPHVHLPLHAHGYR